MATLTAFEDQTGQMSQDQINNENISTIIGEINRTQSQLQQLSDGKQLTVYSDGTTNRYEIGYQTNGWGNGKNAGIKVSKTGIEVTTATDQQLTYKDDFSTRIYYDNTVPRVLEGLLPDGTYGIWVSKPGIDVTTATPSQLIFNSNQDVFKIVIPKTTATIPSVVIPDGSTSNGIASVTVTHNLGFFPKIDATIYDGSPVPGGINWATTLGAPGTYFLAPQAYISLQNVTVNSFDFHIEVANFNYGISGYTYPPVNVTYYLLQETAN